MRQAALKQVHELAKKDGRVVFVGSDLGAGILEEMKFEFPQRFFMEGISEQHMVGFSAGLAKEGFVPYLNTIGTFFIRRAYEQIAIDVALHNLPVRILASGGGMVYAPLGPTHTAIEDFSLMLSIPNIKVFAPADAIEMLDVLNVSLSDPAPMYIRIAKGGEKIVTNLQSRDPYMPKVFGELNSLVTICTTGVVLQHALEAQEILKSINIQASVIHFPFLNNLNISKFMVNFKNAKIIIVAEEHIPRGGLFTQLLIEFYRKKLSTKNVTHFSLPENFSHNYGSQLDHFSSNSLTGTEIADYVINVLPAR
jgi:transketolase